MPKVTNAKDYSPDGFWQCGVVVSFYLSLILLGTIRPQDRHFLPLKGRQPRPGAGVHQAFADVC
ncbi:hypothetical protein BaRGS_00000607, partial [Batillaria attramentaria]